MAAISPLAAFDLDVVPAGLAPARRVLAPAAAATPGDPAEPVGERPPSASPVLAEWLSWWITGLDDAARRELGRRYATRFQRSLGTPEEEDRRRWMVADWLVRSCATRWLHQARLHPYADALAGLAPLRGVEDLASAAGWTRAARRAARVQQQTVRALTHDLVGRPAPAGVWDTISQAVAAAVAEASHPLVRSAIRAGADAGDEWRLMSDTIADAAASVACSALTQVAPIDVWADPLGSARPGLKRPAAELHRSAHRLVDQLLAVTEPPSSGERAT